ncbi:MAG: Plasmid stabilization system protein [Euryarchaeota archaeon ADurb.Bin294]|jgi:mRNA-degrading endonuclease RelE of RelBE toxin-antitoxin system|uniref:type II toxin-antitoxin system RelE family toxin n=1 Tax=Methanospirillum sp. TaxID=45200 RepID=UPI0009C69224|nr:type II toxin-antitoxin system RelE/ParE family toxin [Methanospirillum sp.]OQA56063.1 MAG: Plasmid stabilization system protein [Euryarchaeota archaeon ADurb.Bin294]
MVTVAYSVLFEKTIKKIRDARTKERVKQQIIRVVDNPEIGKPMRYSRKNTREIYIPPFRLSYRYDAEQDLILFLDLYHKNKQ